MATAALLLATGCSEDDASPSASGSTTSSSPPAQSEPTTTTLVPAGSTTLAPSAVSGTGPGTTGAAAATGPALAVSGGWRLVLSQPAPGTSLGSTALLCYEVTGSSREPEVVLEVALLQGSTTVFGPVRFTGSVGRGTARVDLPGVPPGLYDLRVQMVINGERLAGGAATVTGIAVVAGAAPASACG